VAQAERRDPEQELRDAIATFRHDPLGFVRFAFPWGVEGTELAGEAGPRDWQAETLTRIAEALTAGDLGGAIRIAIASGHGVGKSALVSWIILWGLATFPMTKVVITANTGDQLRTKTWPEVAKWFNLLICRHWFRFEATSISARGTNAKTWRVDATTWSENNTTAFQGLHNKGKRIILLFDEASEIADKVWEVSDGAMTDEDTEIIWAVFGNPTVNTGRFRECFAGGRFAHRWIPRQIDARDVQGTNKIEIENAIKDWGEDHDVVRVRYKGQFPRGGAMQFIDNETLEGAITREAVCHLSQPMIMGVDCARGGDDQSVIYFRRGLDARTVPPIKLRVRDLMVLAGKVAEQAMLQGARAVFIDEGGIGAGVVDRVRQLLPGYLVLGINNGGKSDRYTLGDGMPLTANKGAELWASMRHWLKTGAVPDDPELKAELTGREYGFDALNAIRLEKKEDMKKRGLSSPDNADALSLTFAYPVADLPSGTAFNDQGGMAVPIMQDDYNPHADL